jgi:hypothetical protein
LSKGNKMDGKVCVFGEFEIDKIEDGYAISNQFCATGATAIVQIQGYFMQNSTSIPIPFEYHDFEFADEEIYSPWDTMVFNPYYTGRSKEVEIFEQYQVLRNFSMKLLENTKEIDPEIANIVNQNFLKLL